MKEGRKEGKKEGRREGRKEGKKEGRRMERKACITFALDFKGFLSPDSSSSA